MADPALAKLRWKLALAKQKLHNAKDEAPLGGKEEPLTPRAAGSASAAAVRSERLPRRPASH